MKYRRKPTIVEAVQWFPSTHVEGVQFELGRAFVQTMHAGQIVYLEPGDYVLPEPDGIHYYPVKASVFEDTHELLPDGYDDGVASFFDSHC